MYRLTSKRSQEDSQSPRESRDYDQTRNLGAIAVQSQDRLPEFQVNDSTVARYQLKMKPSLDNTTERLKKRRIYLSTTMTGKEIETTTSQSPSENAGLPPPHRFNNEEFKLRIERQIKKQHVLFNETDLKSGRKVEKLGS